MIELFGYHVMRPWWLAAIPAILVLGWLAMRRSTAAGNWDRAIDPALMAAMRQLGRVTPGGRGAGRWPMLAACAIALALTGPTKLRRDGTAYRNLDGIVIVMDMSPQAVAHPRFDAAVTVARLVARAAGTRQVGLVVFAGDAYRASAMTTDARAIGATLALLDAETMPDAGRDPAKGLAYAQQVLDGADIRFGEIVLVSSREALDTSEAREAAAAIEGLSVLLLDEEDGELPGWPDIPRAPVAQPEPVLAALSGATARRLAKAGYTVVVWRDYGRYLLWLAVLPVLLLFGSRRNTGGKRA